MEGSSEEHAMVNDMVVVLEMARNWILGALERSATLTEDSRLSGSPYTRLHAGLSLAC
jgi:hypothetical protein